MKIKVLIEGLSDKDKGREADKEGITGDMSDGTRITGKV